MELKNLCISEPEDSNSNVTVCKATGSVYENARTMYKSIIYQHEQATKYRCPAMTKILEMMYLPDGGVNGSLTNGSLRGRRKTEENACSRAEMLVLNLCFKRLLLDVGWVDACSAQTLSRLVRMLKDM